MTPGKHQVHRIMAIKENFVLIEIRLEDFSSIDREHLRRIVSDGVVTDDEIVELLRIKSIDVPRYPPRPRRRRKLLPNNDIALFAIIVGTAFLLIAVGLALGGL